ncbi:glycosyltransferase family 4 protein [Curtobacterium sp. 1P10AnD]|uniref:glycosyltransferase family 4 protein n=1 Tax=Curtobacterium sp. 1P10AnD TaxID=3132283 RepID=UPI0039A3DF0E
MTTARPLRIALVTSGLAITGGLERCVLEDTEELVAAGHDVVVWHRDDEMARAGEGRPPYERLGVRLVHGTDPRFGVRTAFRDVLRFVREGLRVRSWRPDVIWLNRPEYLPFGRVVSAVSRVPLAVHLHHAPNYGRLRPFAGGRTRYLAVSSAMADAWAAVGAPRDRITIVPNGVDTAEFPPPTVDDSRAAREQLGLPADAPVVLYYGRLSRAKGVVALLEAWSRVRTAAHVRERVACPSAAGTTSSAPVLVLAGALYPDERDAVQQAVDALPDGSVVVLPERDDVLPLLHAADLVVVPSIEPEGFGRTVVEAMSTGTPVVAAASGGTAEILSDEWARYTVDPTDADALAARIVEVLTEAAVDPSLGARCRAWVSARYGRTPHVAALLAALEDHARR